MGNLRPYEGSLIYLMGVDEGNVALPTKESLVTEQNYTNAPGDFDVDAGVEEMERRASASGEAFFKYADGRSDL